MPRLLFTFFYLFIICFSQAAAQGKGYRSPLQRAGYQLIWHEDFTTSTLDTTSWAYQIGDGCPQLCGWGNNELQYYTDNARNIFLKDGLLHIVAHAEAMQGKAYTSARIRTKGKRDFRYGRIDVRARLPKGQGIWPAIWFMPTDDVYGGWPKSGEIDLMELVGHEPEVLWGTVHYGPDWPNNKLDNNRYYLPKGDFSERFHVFSLIWEENQITWLLNDTIVYQRITPAMLVPEPYPFNERFHLLINLAVGGNWPGNPDSTTNFPQTMLVDYVRVYARR